MNIVDRFDVRSFKCMMALVLATGIVPVAPALADETGPTAAKETTTPTASETSGEEASTINAAPIDNVSDEIPDIPNESPAQPNESDDPIVPSEAADSTSVAELFSDDSAIVTNDTADGSPEQSTVSNIWQTWGTCEWMVDDQGCLTIRPANGAAEGQLPDTYLNTTYIPWRASEIRSSIKAIMVDPGVKTSTSCSALFSNLNKLEEADLSRLDTASTTDMNHMFAHCSSLTSLDLSGWDTSRTSNMMGVFFCCSSLSSLNVSNWDTSKATNMAGMFYCCFSLASLDVSKWDTSRVTDMFTMLYSCKSLSAIDVSHWDTSQVTDIGGMFMGCQSLTSLDVSNWNTSNATNMSGTFYDCSSVTSLDVSKWNVSRATGMKEAFKNCSSLTSLDLSGWDASNVSSIEDMLSGNSGLRHIAVSDKLACDMPTPNFEGATGLWVDTATGTAYEPDAVPKNTAAAYDAQTKATYAHSTTTSQNGVAFTVQWNDAPAGQATTFHVTQTDGSPNAKVRMDVPTYWDPDGTQESVCDPSRNQWSGASSYKTIGDNGYDFTFEFTASGSYNICFYFMDTDNNVGYLRTTDVWTSVNDASHPSVSQIVSNTVTQAKTETDGSEYAMALWLHDWTLDQLEYDHSLNWCSAESGLTRHQGTCESYQRIYAKLLNAGGIANGRITGNGHTWNAVKIDGKWCQMDLTWDDTNDNWYGDLDQRHLYFGLTDELMAIAHSDHTANYQAEGYAYRSTDLSNNYFVRNGIADKWAEAYAERIQQHLDARETEFSIDADNESFPPSIIGIQNGIVAYAMNQRKWSTNNVEVDFTASSNVTTQSSSRWSAKYVFVATYGKVPAVPARTVEDGEYLLASALDPRMAVSAAASGCSLSASAGAIGFSYDEATGCYRLTSGGMALTATGASAALREPDGSASQLWRVEACGGGWSVTSRSTGLALDVYCRSTREGGLVWLYEPNGTDAQAWALEAPAARTVEDGEYLLASALDPRMAVSAAASGCSLSASAGAIGFSYDEATGCYRLTSGGMALTATGASAALREPDGSASQLWRVEACGGGWSVTSRSTGLALDVYCRSTREGGLVWLYEPNGTDAQAWALEAL